jgi:hypothetical protein
MCSNVTRIVDCHKRLFEALADDTAITVSPSTSTPRRLLAFAARRYARVSAGLPFGAALAAGIALLLGQL